MKSIIVKERPHQALSEMLTFRVDGFFCPFFGKFKCPQYFHIVEGLTKKKIDLKKNDDPNHDFGYSFPLFSSLLKKREGEKENE
jgi:hypothetical protein